jgi:predicted ATPase
VLTRLKVSGFKNLVDTDIRFGPFTCIAGPNAVGKSNLFDAIRFLNFLASGTLFDAARSIRSEGSRSGDVRSLFHRADGRYDDGMVFEAEMIIPDEGADDLGQRAEAAITFLRYKVEIGYKTDRNLPSLGSLVLLREELDHINLGEAYHSIGFPHSAKSWRNEVVKGKRTTPFISTKGEGGNRVIKLSQDGTKGRPRSFAADNLPRTVLSTVNATESPTALLARREMQSWRVLRLEPDALREPDRLTAPPGLGPDGAHLPATLFRLARSEADLGDRREDGPGRVYDRVALRLSELTDNTAEVGVDVDEQRELLTLYVTERDGTVYTGRSLSDGALRFLALAAIEVDPAASGVVCLEEPENGIHPGRIPAMLRLLRDIACDPERPAGVGNRLRQVIVNTYSPAVVSQVPDDSLLAAEPRVVVIDGVPVKKVHFGWLPDTWRTITGSGVPTVARDKLLAFFSSVSQSEPSPGHPPAPGRREQQRNSDVRDMQGVLSFSKDGE